MWSGRDSVEYHEQLVGDLSVSQMHAYHYVRRHPSGRMADDLAVDLGINPLTAGVVMHDLAERGLVQVIGNGTTSRGGTARRYAACDPTQLPPPLPDPVKQSLEDKHKVLEEAAVLIGFVLEHHPDTWGPYLDVDGDDEPRFHRLLTHLANLRRSVQGAQRNGGRPRTL